MKITVITQDQLIVVDGKPAFMGDIGGFEMSRGEWAINYDTVTGVGHIEYTDNRPNQKIYTADFDNSYSWLLDEHQRYLTETAIKEAAEEEARNEQPEEDPILDSGDTGGGGSV
ncbi:hypothetical protein [Photobacterium sp. 53610]|uniref:hypothetical protein n=1 Tax=Photobacterium sp. 53610 TaxID=3102789 RepID=UPI002ED91995